MRLLFGVYYDNCSPGACLLHHVVPPFPAFTVNRRNGQLFVISVAPLNLQY